MSDAINASLMARRLNTIGFFLFSLLAIITGTVIIVKKVYDDDDDYDYNN